MKKNFIVNMVTIIFIFATLTSCINNVHNTKNDTIQLWYYVDNIDKNYLKIINKIINSVKVFCKNNNINLEIHAYDTSTLTLEDYIFKRNLASSLGNMISIDDIDYIRDLSLHHADYTKLEIYNRLFSGYKNRFCIPLYSYNPAKYINNEVLECYNINTNKALITYTDYLEIKHQMKEKGARFNLSNMEYNQLRDYYLSKNNLLFLNEQSKILNTTNNFKKSLKKVILDVVNDISSFYNSSFKIGIDRPASLQEEKIFDLNSNLIIEESYFSAFSQILNPSNYYDILKNNKNTTFYIYPLSKSYTSSFFMHKKITNEKIYDLANYILSEKMYLLINGSIANFTPSFETEKIRNVLKIDNYMEYIGDHNKNEKIKDSISSFYKMLASDEENSKEIADYYYYNRDIYNNINFFIYKLIYDIAYELSGDNLSLAKFDPNDKKINKMIDDKINEFVLNFALHNN